MTYSVANQSVCRCTDCVSHCEVEHVLRKAFAENVPAH